MEVRDISYIVVHCSATKFNSDVGLKEINEWHLDKGWDGCGYHFVIRRNGTLETGRSLSKKGAILKVFHKFGLMIWLV